jgi:hypothetical protein
MAAYEPHVMGEKYMPVVSVAEEAERVMGRRGAN